MSATNTFETNLLALIITNVDCPNIGDATGLRGSTTVGVFWISLHTGSPGEAGTQTTSEAAYTNYARQDEARNTTQWTITGNIADNDNAIAFPSSGSGPETLTDFGLGFNQTTAGNLQLFGALTASLIVNSGVIPEFAAGALDVTLD